MSTPQLKISSATFEVQEELSQLYSYFLQEKHLSKDKQENVVKVFQYLFAINSER